MDWLIIPNPRACPEWWEAFHAEQPELIPGDIFPLYGKDPKPVVVSTASAEKLRAQATRLRGWPKGGGDTPLTFSRHATEKEDRRGRWAVTMWVSEQEKKDIETRAKKVKLTAPTYLREKALGRV